MEKSIWLKKLGISMFNRPDSTLSVSYRYLKRLVKCEDAVLYLKEISEENDFAILLHQECAVLFDLCDEYATDDREAFERAKENRTAVQCNDCFISPLSCSKADCFGYILFKKENVKTDDELTQAIASFGELIYSELNGGFMISSHKNVIAVNNIVLRYGNSAARNVVDHISLKINEGELTVIMGKSGCGKSSLLNVIAGLLSPNEGEVLYHGKNICTMNEKEKTDFRKDDLGYIFQNYNLIGELSASENVSIASVLSSKSIGVEKALSLVNLEEFGNYYPSQMSGGMQQRVAIARALVKNASILLCDEPTGALDSENAKAVMVILQDIAHTQNIPVVVVSHNADYAVLADHYILLKDGHIEEEYYNHFAFRASEVL